MAKPADSGTAPTSTPSTTPTKETPKQEAPKAVHPDDIPNKDIPDDAPYWGCPRHNHWGTRDPEKTAIKRDGTYYCPECPGTKLIRAG